MREFVNDNFFDHRDFAAKGVEQLLLYADTDKDGAISEKEWISWIQNRKEVEKFQEGVAKLLPPLDKNDLFKNSYLLKEIVLKSCKNLVEFF